MRKWRVVGCCEKIGGCGEKIGRWVWGVGRGYVKTVDADEERQSDDDVRMHDIAGVCVVDVLSVTGDEVEEETRRGESDRPWDSQRDTTGAVGSVDRIREVFNDSQVHRHGFEHPFQQRLRMSRRL
jgi:hypothetical protein